MSKKQVSKGHAAFRARLRKEVGRRIALWRECREWRQAELAQLIGISRTSVSNIEHGRHNLLLVDLYVIAHVLRVKLTDLLPAKVPYAK